ncbi:MAG: ribokinase [Cyanobacteria bacterium J069]
MSVIVFGSLNMDLVARTPRLPGPGETLTGHNFETVPGGKGANQAVAVARLGVPTAMVGRVGGDSFGRDLLRGLQESGVACDRVLVDSSTHSGIAMIAVDDASENTIILVPGANGRVDESDVARLAEILPQATALLLQLEIPLPMVVAAAKAAKAAGVTVIFDPAPAHPDLPLELFPLIDIITPNQVETGQLVGFPIPDLATAQKAAVALHERGVGTVITKLGKAGALCVTRGETFEIPTFPVQAVDTVAAGDSFNGGLAAGLAAGLTLRQATTQAAAVAALSVSKPGAQPSLPTRAELQAFLTERSVSLPGF